MKAILAVITYLFFGDPADKVALSASIHDQGKGAYSIVGPISAEDILTLRRRYIEFVDIRGKTVNANIFDDAKVFRLVDRVVLTEADCEQILPRLSKVPNLNWLRIKQKEPLDCRFLSYLKNPKMELEIDCEILAPGKDKLKEQTDDLPKFPDLKKLVLGQETSFNSEFWEYLKLAHIDSLTLYGDLAKPKECGLNMPSSLKELAIRNANVVDSDLANLPALPFLRSLNIENCPVDGSFLKDLQAPSLLFVRLRSAKLNEQCLANLKQFPKLTNLEVQSHALSLGKAELLAIADLPSLTKLNMLAGSIDVNALPALARAKKLKEIRCESSDCDPNFLQGIIDCKKLEYVFLGARPSDDALRLFKKKHPRCEISYLGAWQDKKGRK